MATTASKLSRLTIDGKEYNVFQASFESLKPVDQWNRVTAFATKADARFVIEGKEDTTALFYALQESDKAEDANEVAKGLANSQNPRVELKGLPIGNPNDAWMDAQQLSAQAGVYGGDLPGSEAGLEALVAKAPGNVGLRLAQADMYRARDLPRRAEGILKET